MGNISLPHEWSAREYQQRLINYMLEGGMERKRAAEVWHRRAGKDSVALNLTAVAAHMRVGTYWHMLPTNVQARKVVWNGIDRQGRRMIDQAFPVELREQTHETDMFIRFKNGSMWQLCGSDNYDSLIGSNPIGVILSEYSVADPKAWDYIRPILAENDGWAIFIYTFRGKNHGFHLSEMAKNNPKWFHEILTILDTKREDGSPVIGEDVIQDERDSGMDEQMIQQEYYCSPDAGIAGAYYTNQLRKAREEERIGAFPWIETELVQTYWDLGIADSTSIIFTQRDGEYCRIIDHISGSGRSLHEWIKICRDLPYVYEEHRAPHDIKNRELTTGKTRQEVADSLGFRFEMQPKMSIMDGIDAARSMFSRIRFNEKKTIDLINSLDNYRKAWDDKKQVFTDRPLHDWSSHDADAFRGLAVSWVDKPSMFSEDVLPFKVGRRKPKVIRSVEGPGKYGRQRY